MERLQHTARLRAGLILALALAAPVMASDSGSWWNPFHRPQAEDQRSPATARISATRRPAPPEPSIWEKMNSGTKSFFTKTWEMLTPWDDTPDPPARSRGVTGSRRSTASGNRKAQEKSSFSWFGSEKEEQKIESANDFLKLPRPY